MSNEQVIIDRRGFIVAAGAAAAVVFVPLAGAAPAPVVGTASALADWHIDDMWGVYPRPSESIGYAPPQAELTVAAHHPVDAAYLA